ncbi:MAG: EAL domain-containing protein [Gammaproteobacteria bacterium]|nr:EAL domain-containing protein [Gammaproteobacteria bacterium]
MRIRRVLGAAALRCVAAAAAGVVGRRLVRAAAQLRRAARLGARAMGFGRRSSLITQILTLQLAIVTAVGLLALGGLYWTSRTVIDDNLSHWARQWAAELNELGAPFYVSNMSDAILDVERFIAKYPEIRAVSWYRPSGEPVLTLNPQGQPFEDAEKLDAAAAAELAAYAGEESPFRLIENPEKPLAYRLAGPIWTESTLGDGLLGLGGDVPVETQIELLGFVGVDLDFSSYHAQFLPKLWLASLTLLGLLGLSWVAGRVMMKRALSPLAALQGPLADLANGDLDVSFPTSRHSEIQRIVNALEETTVALNERDRRLVHLAMHDSLTGLMNRHSFVIELEQELERIESQNSRGAVLFVDLDQFKYVNDTCGHPAGDELLKLAGRSIMSAVRSSDVVARFGGDEFAVLLKEVTRQHTRSIASKILEQMRALTHVQDEKVFSLQCSIGIAEITSEHTDPHELLSQADLACHVAKSKGRNRLEFYRVSAKESRQMTKDIDWVKSIREALDENLFTLHYQPLVHVRTGIANHYEALLRLRHRNGTLIEPQVFLPAAERFGLLSDIDRWVVDHAMRTLAGMRHGRPDLRFSINVSASAIDDGDFSSFVRTKLKEHGLPGDAVIFELTEQEAIRFALHAAKQMAAIRELGCGIAIDDFGTGYSSFAYLKRLPVDYLKIDGSFVKGLERDPVDQTMVRLIGEVAKAAGIKTVAEYVQNGTAMALLARFRIDYAQGFYLGRPAESPQETSYPVPLAGSSAPRRATQTD